MAGANQQRKSQVTAIFADGSRASPWGAESTDTILPLKPVMRAGSQWEESPL